MDLPKEKRGCVHYVRELSSGVINSSVVRGEQGLEELTLKLGPEECLGSSLELRRKDKEIRSGFVYLAENCHRRS